MQSGTDNQDVELAWEEHPSALRRFIDARTNYEALCNEVAYILENLKYRDTGWHPPLPALFEKYDHLIEKRPT
jgi:hypothetical protein